METTMQHSKFPCNFQHRGCNLRLTFNEKYVQQHEDTCTFRSAVCCPFDCLWRGSQLQLVPHLIKKHQVHIHNMDKQSKYKLKIKKRDANDERGLQLLALKWHDCLFFLVLTKSRNALIKQESPEQYYTYILRSGPQLCTKFFCRLAIMSHDDQEEMALEWTPRCVFDGMLFAPADNLLNCFPLNRSLDPRKIRVTITDKEKQESVTFTVKLRNKCQKLVDNRNRKLEKFVMKSQLFNCKYETNGCKVILNAEDMVEHENCYCLYIPYKCFVSMCEWQGTYLSFQDHFRDCHVSNYFDMDEDTDEAKKKSIKILRKNIPKLRNEGEISFSTIVLKYQGSRFMLVVSGFKNEKKLFHAACIVRIGPKKCREDFSYRFEIVDANEELIVFESKPRSILVAPLNKPWRNELILGDIPTLVNMTELLTEMELLSIFECSNIGCNRLVTPPIYQSKHGYNVCSRCRPDCTDATVRNLSLEKVLEKLPRKYACRYEKDGCDLSFNYIEQFDHYNYQCFFRSFKCFIYGCDWKGSLKSFEQHLRTSHAGNFEDLESAVDDGIKIKFSAENFSPRHRYSFMIFNRDGCQFLLAVVASKGIFSSKPRYVTFVVHIGPWWYKNKYYINLKFINKKIKVKNRFAEVPSIYKVKFSSPIHRRHDSIPRPQARRVTRASRRLDINVSGLSTRRLYLHSSSPLVTTVCLG
ncbi:Hypothetical predicted protein [Cloeon dipterum]|uniref:SIAH-type domain-containing protein n=1 Tax=Cloeon dipterum TaxID=197152 RepID=A0A8S1C9E7_9INSE|nr:Hypothetical predicted protein [Cloeon dipterum]